MAKVKEETFYLAKYALSDGIEEVLGTVVAVDDDDYVNVKGIWVAHKLGRYIFRTREEAVAKADELRKKKIASLHKQIKKLSEMVFE